MVLGQPWCQHCRRLPGTCPHRALCSLCALLLPSGTYLTARCGAVQGRACPPFPHCWPPPLPPTGAGGAELVSEQGRGGCPEREGHQHPHEPGAGSRAEPGAGPALLLPLLSVLQHPPTLAEGGGGGWCSPSSASPHWMLPALGALGLEASLWGPGSRLHPACLRPSAPLCPLPGPATLQELRQGRGRETCSIP